MPSAHSASPLSIPVCEVSPQLVVALAAFTVKLNVADCVCAGLLESVTLNVSEVAVTAAVGVPVIAPVDGFSVSPDGSVPLVSDQLYGVVPPVAPNAAVYELPTCPLGSDVVVIASEPEEFDAGVSVM